MAALSCTPVSAHTQLSKKFYGLSSGKSSRLSSVNLIRLGSLNLIKSSRLSSINPGLRLICRCSTEAITDEKWLKLLPDKKSALYSHSLPCIEAWLRSLGFTQSKEDRASWIIQRPDWHAQLSLEITELRIRYLKSGPGSLERDVERKFSYALCREDLENAILGGP